MTSTSTSTSAAQWFALPVLTGRLIRLRPMVAEDSAGYLAAAGTGADAEDVFRWVSTPGAAADGAPRTLDDAHADVLAGLAARAHGVRFPYAQVDAQTDEFAGSTSLYEVDPALRTLAVGHTWLGKRWWRTGHNTESKLLLLTHAFDTLGAARVVWHTDIYNERSQAAIARLGAVREAEMRKHRIRRDGSWRTTVQFSMTDDDWPAARKFLTERLAAHE
ncbi:GNAT family N-acetyltransferase [uncultured Jatrophihabitans sp.]|uniref:GNAT family N-acetyltransferase n=1 Tax=uncultured Jatrophihabitans sp. TaxID=1610747 RepID=UPI0035CB849E